MVLKSSNAITTFKVRLCLLIIALYVTKKLKICSAFTNSDELNEFVDGGENHLKNYYEDYNILDLKNRSSCRYFRFTRQLFCNGTIDYNYLKEIKNERIINFLIENYESEISYRKILSLKNLETGEWYMKLPKVYQKLTGEINLKDAGLQINVNLRMLPNKGLKGFLVEGEAFSNKVIKISWRLKGNLFLEFLKNRTVILLNIGAVGDSDWKIQSNMTFLRRDREKEIDIWKARGVIKSNYVSENQFAIFNGIIQTKMMKEVSRFLGDINLLNLDASVSGFFSKHKKGQITIPKSAFSNMTIENIEFRNSNFYNDFDKNSFEGLQGLIKIAFVESKLESMPRLDQLFHTFKYLEEIYFENCITPGLRFGGLTTSENVQKLTFKGTGPLSFDNGSFLWLRNSSLSYLSFRNSHVIVSTKESSILWSVRNTLKYLDLSYSTVTEERDLILLLKQLSIINLLAEGLKLKKIPTNALSNVKETLTYLSLKENNFRKNFEKHIFDNILEFPLMVNLRELNLENCHINYIEKGTFDNLPNLKILHLSYNSIENLQDGWIHLTPTVSYLNLSHNFFTPQLSSLGLYDMCSSLDFRKFKNLKILDVSNGVFTNITKLINGLGKTVKSLYLRNTRLQDIPDIFFENLTDLEVLDLSQNRNLKFTQFFSFDLFKNLKSLKTLKLNNCKIKGAFTDKNDTLDNGNILLKHLEILDLSMNNLKVLDTKILLAFPNLKILNLSGNSITHWSKLYLYSQIETFYIDENKIEKITSDMLFDIKKLKNVKLGENPFVCGPYVYEFLEIINADSNCTNASKQYFNNNDGYLVDSQFMIQQRIECNQEKKKILDWSERNYVCFSWSQEKFIPFTHLNENFEDSARHKNKKNITTLLWLIIVIVVGVVVSVAIVCWKYMDIHLITRAVRSAVALSFVGLSQKESTNFKYNVFVSYCDKDRPWVIENLLPHLESKNEVKVCLHERDFQVGLSIIENILNSIENSRNIILLISKAFLKSQWCQYEMQLAQFRLIEKGRDQLILIFLENIPTVKRPKTLKYLMMTKTYIEWPTNPKSYKEIDVFWNRLMKSLDQKLL